MAVLASTLAGGATIPVQACEVTRAEDLLVEVAPMAGEYPVWAAGGASAGAGWCCSTCGMKTLWITARSQQGDLQIRGHKLEDEGVALLQSGWAKQPSDQLVIRAAHSAPGVRPNTRQEVLRKYAFWPSGVIYPSPGCWEMIANYGDREVRIIQYLEDVHDSPQCKD